VFTPQEGEVSLYEALAEPAPASSPAGETVSTKAKETIDRDAEAFVMEEVMLSA
jgi:hypothetical protein